MEYSDCLEVSTERVESGVPGALSSSDREAISRGLSSGYSMRQIAKDVGHSPSTISREISKNGGVVRIEPRPLMQKRGIKHDAPSYGPWRSTDGYGPSSLRSFSGVVTGANFWLANGYIP